MKNKISIIMRSCNDIKYIADTLKVVFSQTIKDFELINFDNSSTDGTLEVIRKYNKKGKIINIPKGEYVPGKVLNKGISLAKGNIIVFLNSDATPIDEFWLENLINCLNKEIVAVYSRQVVRKGAYLPVKRDYLVAYPPKGKRSLLSEPMFSFVSVAFYKKIWEENKFYEKGYSEDMEWMNRITKAGFKYKYVPDSIVCHSHNYTIKQLFRKRYRHGLALLNYNNKKKVFIYCNLFRRLIIDVLKDYVYCLKRINLKTIFYSPTYRATIFFGYLLGLSRGLKYKRRA